MCVERLGSAPWRGGYVTVLLVCPGWPPDVSVCRAHGLLFDGAMCSHVDCLSPPVLLLNHCFSGSSCVSLVTLVCLPIVLLVSAVLCWSVVFRVSNVWLCSSLLPACLFFPFGVIFVLCFILLLKITFSSAFESSTSSLVTKNSEVHRLNIFNAISRQFVHILRGG